MFGKLKDWFPNIAHVDPTFDEIKAIGSKYVVISAIKYPTYQLMTRAGRTVADSKMIGLIQDFTFPQIRPIQRAYEIGSRYPYSIPGKYSGDLALSSIFFDSAGNILGNIIASAYGLDDPDTSANDRAIGERLLNRPLLYRPGDTSGTATYSMADVGSVTTGDARNNVRGNLRFSLDDNALDRPFGMVMSFFQSEERLGIGSDITSDQERFKISACLFFEMCKVTSYNLALRADVEIIQENASFFYSGLANVKTSLTSSLTGINFPEAV